MLKKIVFFSLFGGNFVRGRKIGRVKERSTVVQFRIKDETLRQTKRCAFDFRCLSEDTIDVCSIDRCFTGLCVLEKAKPGFCPYRFSFADRHVCYCPTRAELHMIHGI